MNIYDTFGFRLDDLRAIQEGFKNLTGIVLEPHYSTYKGGEYYFKGSMGNESYILQKNFCNEEGWTEDNYQEFLSLLYISNAPEIDRLRSLLLEKFRDDILLIKRVTISEDNWYRKYVYVDGEEKLVLERKTMKSTQM
jgi:hypothetical protein